MEIETIRHKALRALVETGSSTGVIEQERVIDMIAYILAAGTFDDLKVPPNFGLHPLKGNRKGEWAMTVTKNWRMTFKRIDDETISELNLEDYH